MARPRIALAEARKAYPAEVERLAVALRPELSPASWESGATATLDTFPAGEAPYHLEDEIASATSPRSTPAFVIVAASPHAKDLRPDGRDPAYPGIAAAATNAMASDVIEIARAAG